MKHFIEGMLLFGAFLICGWIAVWCIVSFLFFQPQTIWWEGIRWLFAIWLVMPICTVLGIALAGIIEDDR